MKKIALLFLFLPLVAVAETDAQIALNDALGVVRTNCSGVSARMETIKKMAGIGTVVNAVGTATGVGGVTSGVVKYKTDVEMVKNIGEKAGLDSAIEKLKQKELSPENQKLLKMALTVTPDLEKNLIFLSENLTDEQIDAKIQELETKSADLKSKIDEQQRKSTAAGNIRTGLFATDTVTNVAGAVVASKTKVDEDFVAQITKCTESLGKLRNARIRVKTEDGSDADKRQMDLSQNILDKCSEYEYMNLQQLNSLSKGALVTNSVGAATGMAATITSALGNKNNLSNVNFADTASVQKVNQYGKINVASNFIGGVTTAASLTGTVLNATQIKTAKKILDIAQKCEEALQ